MPQRDYDLLVLKGLGKLQRYQDITCRADRDGFKMERFSSVIVVATKPSMLCQPFFNVQREDLKSLIPSLAQMLDRLDPDCPPVSVEAREMKYVVNNGSGHQLANVLQEVQLLAIADMGKCHC